MTIQNTKTVGGLEKKVKGNGFMSNITAFPLFLNGEKTIIDLPEGTNRHFIVRDGSRVKEGYICFIEFYRRIEEQNGFLTYTGTDMKIEFGDCYKIPDGISHIPFEKNISNIYKRRKN